MIRPPYRWKSFWFGVLVLAFLGWAWIVFASDPVTLDWSRGRVVYSVGSGSGQVTIRKRVQTGHYGGDGIRVNKIAMFGPRSRDHFPDALHWQRSSKWFWKGGIAHWFLILLFLVPWAGWLAWRWRRIKRLTRMEPKE